MVVQVALTAFGDCAIRVQKARGLVILAFQLVPIVEVAKVLAPRPQCGPVFVQLVVACPNAVAHSGIISAMSTVCLEVCETFWHGV